MRVLIWFRRNSTREAEARAKELRAEGHKVGLRSARYFSEAEPCDLCVCDWDAMRVREAYEAAGMRVEWLREPANVVPPADIPAPAKEVVPSEVRPEPGPVPEVRTKRKYTRRK